MVDPAQLAAVSRYDADDCPHSSHFDDRDHCECYRCSGRHPDVKTCKDCKQTGYADGLTTLQWDKKNEAEWTTYTSPPHAQCTRCSGSRQVYVGGGEYVSCPDCLGTGFADRQTHTAFLEAYLLKMREVIEAQTAELEVLHGQLSGHQAQGDRNYNGNQHP